MKNPLVIELVEAPEAIAKDDEYKICELCIFSPKGCEFAESTSKEHPLYCGVRGYWIIKKGKCNTIIKIREVLEKYNQFLLDCNYTDNDIWCEEPTAIERFLEEIENGNDEFVI